MVKGSTYLPVHSDPDEPLRRLLPVTSHREMVRGASRSNGRRNFTQSMWTGLLKVVTNEKDTCRREGSDGRCIESDYVFNLEEQYQPTVDSYPNLTGVQVDAGYVEIVGNKRVVPRKLLAILQEHGMLSPTPPERRAALERLLADLY